VALTVGLLWGTFIFLEYSQPFEAHDYLEAVLWPLGAVGLYGFAFRRAFIKQVLWKVFFVIVLVAEVVYPAYLAFIEWPLVEEEGVPIFGIASLIALALMVPYYVALFLYGYMSGELWRAKSS
jgi:hypothetical protein